MPDFEWDNLANWEKELVVNQGENQPGVQVGPGGRLEGAIVDTGVLAHPESVIKNNHFRSSGSLSYGSTIITVKDPPLPKATPAKRVYLAGPMRGIKHFNFEAFNEAADRLRSLGYIVWSPATHDLDHGFDPVGHDLTGDEDLTLLGFNLRTALSNDLKEVSEADAIALLPGYERSSGARAELALAAALGLEALIISEIDGGIDHWSAKDVDAKLRRGDDPLVVPTAVRSVTISPDGTLVNVDGENYVRQDTVNDVPRLPTGEVRVTSATGGQKGSKPERFDLIPAGPLTQLARHFGKGAEKYADRNWELGTDWHLNFAALQRHAWAFWGGEDIDPETGSPHIIAVAWQAFVLAEFMTTHPELDNRPKVA